MTVWFLKTNSWSDTLIGNPHWIYFLQRKTVGGYWEEKVLWEGYREWLRNKDKLKEMRQKVGGEEYQRIPKGRKDIYKDLQELILKTPEGKQEGMFSSHIKERITKMVNETQEVLKGVSQGRFYKKIKL